MDRKTYIFIFIFFFVFLCLNSKSSFKYLIKNNALNEKKDKQIERFSISSYYMATN